MDLPDTPALPTLLVIDDDEASSLHTQLMLARAGLAARVHAVDSGEAGLAFLRQPQPAPLGGEPAVELILLDMHMPGMDGLQFLQAHAELAAHLQARTIVVLSAEAGATERTRAFAHAKVRDFLLKPLDGAQVRRLHPWLSTPVPCGSDSLPIS